MTLDASPIPTTFRASAAHSLLLSILLTMLPSIVSAQGTSAPSTTARRAPSVSVAFGWNDTIAAERFAPIWVTIDPGSRPLDGTASLVVPQDAIQDARLVAPFAAAPGRPAVVEFAASLPIHLSRVMVQVRDQSGRLVASQTYSQSATGRDLPFPPSLLMYEDVIATVGVPSLASASRTWSPGVLPAPSRTQGAQASPGTGSAPLDLFQHVVIADVSPERLPTAWIAYDGLRCLVLRASSTRSIPPQAASAIKDWILDGGRLVLIADEPGPEWMVWLDDRLIALGAAPDADVSPSASSRLAVDLGDVRQSAVPVGLADVISLAPREAGQGDPVASPGFAHRPVWLSSIGPSLGWRTHWSLGDGASAPAMALLAEGPVGLGFVCVLGFDPADAILGVDASATATIWKHVLAGALEPVEPTGDRRDDINPWYVQGSGDHAVSRAGLTACLDSLADFQVPSGGVFYLVGGAGFLLALLVGPFDAVFLKRTGRRQHSWLTALGWIAGASLLAWVLPTLAQEGRGRLARLNVIDQIHDTLGRPVLSRQTALTGIFSARSGDAALRTPDPTAWWRGVSSVASFSFSSRARDIGAPFTLAIEEVSRPSGTGVGVAGAGSSLRSSSLRSMPMPMWTFRTLMERGSGSLPIIATITGSRDAGWRVSIAGMPDGASVSGALLCVGDASSSLELGVDARSGHLVAPAVLLDPSSAEDGRRPLESPAWFPPTSRFRAGGAYDYTPGLRTSLDGVPGLALRVPGPDSREDAARRLLESGHFALLLLSISGLPPDASSGLTDEPTRGVIARLVLPLPEPVRATPTPRWVPPIPPRAAPWPPADTGPEGEDPPA